MKTHLCRRWLAKLRSCRQIIPNWVRQISNLRLATALGRVYQFKYDIPGSVAELVRCACASNSLNCFDRVASAEDEQVLQTIKTGTKKYPQAEKKTLPRVEFVNANKSNALHVQVSHGGARRHSQFAIHSVKNLLVRVCRLK